jgi:hypothetical protein
MVAKLLSRGIRFVRPRNEVRPQADMDKKRRGRRKIRDPFDVPLSVYREIF